MQWYLKVLREYANFEGRARRTEYWMFQLFNAIAVFVAMIVDVTIGVAVQFPVPVLTIAYSLATMVPAIAVSIRRLHDTDRSGWWLLLSLVPFGSIVILVFDCLDGTPWPNRYGSNPKAVTAPYQPQFSGPTYQGPTYA
jgi:uncharacterized membrane protein YhaH (DUF805 family)